MAKVKFNNDWFGPDSGYYRKGETYDLSEELVKALPKSATLVEEKAPPKEEKKPADDKKPADPVKKEA